MVESHMAVGTGFGQLFRGIGQVGGVTVAVSSAIFQSILDRELRRRITDPNADEVHSSLCVRDVGSHKGRTLRLFAK